MKKIIVSALLGLSVTATNAYEVKKVCAKYQTNYSWSQDYQVQAQIYSGRELNEATGNPYFGKYDMFSHYAVIWWDKGQASIIEINDIYYKGAMLFNTNGVDQNGRQWQLSDNNYGVCYSF